MNDTQLNIKLALHLGWKQEDIKVCDTGTVLVLWKRHGGYRQFHYMHWETIAPLAAVYDCFPIMNFRGGWVTDYLSDPLKVVYADTPQKTIALAILGEEA